MSISLLKKYLFIYVWQIILVAHGSLVAACELFVVASEI